MAPEEDLTEHGWKGTRLLPSSTTEFTANNRVYRVSRSMSFDRYEAYELLQVELGMARTFEQFRAQIQEAYDLCNKVATGKPVFADMAVVLRDLLIGAALVGERQTPTVLKLCALFINREGEDVGIVDDELIQSKIADWRAEGLDMRFFFQFALSSIPGFIEALRAASPDTSGSQKENRAPGNTSRRAPKPSSA